MSWDSRERRKFVRVEFLCEITVSTPQDHIILTHAKNISAGGIRVIIEEKLETSSIVSLEIHGIKKEPISCQGKVRWVFTRELPHRKDIFVFDTGIEFCQIKDQDIREIKNLVVSIASGKYNSDSIT